MFNADNYFPKRGEKFSKTHIVATLPMYVYGKICHANFCANYACHNFCLYNKRIRFLCFSFSSPTCIFMKFTSNFCKNIAYACILERCGGTYVIGHTFRMCIIFNIRMRKCFRKMSVLLRCTDKAGKWKF